MNFGGFRDDITSRDGAYHPLRTRVVQPVVLCLRSPLSITRSRCRQDRGRPGMVLEEKSLSTHNVIVNSNNVVMQSTTKKIPHPASTRYNDNRDDDDDFPSPIAKRRKIETLLQTPSKDAKSLYGNSPLRSPRRDKRVYEDHENENELEQDVSDERLPVQTQLETALPPVQTDKEAIEAYEAYKAGEAQDDSENLHTRLENRSWIRGRSSIYVDAFNLALETVLKEESHLFDEAENTVFSIWRDLGYEAQYLYVRLFLRKTAAWHRIGRLGYYDDITDMDSVVAELQLNRKLPKVEEEVKPFPGEAVLPEDAMPLGTSFQFAECSEEHINTLDEASSLLLLDELKVLAKEAKVQGKNKRELLQNLRKTSGKQAGLGFLKRSETEESINSNEFNKDSQAEDEDETSTSGTHTPISKYNRDAHYTKKILDQTGKCIRLSLLPLKLFERVHLVFYRSTEWTEKSLTTLLLAKISRRNFPNYIVSRSANIFESRSLLLEFEASLRTQFRVDNVIEFSHLPVHKQVDAVRSIFEAVYPRWRVLLAKEQEKEDRVYETGEGAYLRRFSPAWVYTRIVHKGLWPLARLREHKREHELLTELLGQYLFHASRRGAWYQRKALLEEHYMYALSDAEGRSEEANKKFWKRVSLRTCEQGLEDNECHIIYHYDLQKRITKLEKQLKIPKREQHEFSHVGLSKARERTVEGFQIVPLEREETPARRASLQRKDSNGRSQSRERTKGQEQEQRAATPTNTRRGGGKTTWLDELDTNEYVSVEALCLSHYRHVLGYKGYHSEGGILRCLFGLLFYDIMFDVYVPNVFQTAYQTCPLDLHTDAFYSARISEINSRINELAEPGRAARILQRVWDEYREQKICVIGVRWEEYELDDLLEIVYCFTADGQGKLGVVMRVLAQEYGARGGGVPDLFLWKKEENGSGKVMFSEVKSENDRLSDTQRLWISVLLNAGIEVELCHAAARETRPE
ncbi:hypothetical protein LTR64_007635 [Lithohypha guttulata]|uniref:uncharacterized protein n=1 Tax=Lithohypha guttulata TaxID=1690604 RepID=UPI002DDE65A4|nr:hypothetical protein LTR51_007144 [Lithohypha guttulata]